MNNKIDYTKRFQPQRQSPSVPASPRQLVITIDFPTPDQMTIQCSRPTNSIELGLIAAQITMQQIQALAVAQAQLQSRPDPTKPHGYDVNPNSQKSLIGGACGVCGQPRDSVGIHPLEMEFVTNGAT